MIKQIVSTLILVISMSAHASTLNWSALKINRIYSLNQEVKLADDQYQLRLAVNSRLTLKERTFLDMLNVEVFKFDIGTSCPSRNMETDIELIDIKQPNGKLITVGIDLAEGCLLEVYVEQNDLNTLGLFY
jgi:hypothetical protein